MPLGRRPPSSARSRSRSRSTSTSRGYSDMAIGLALMFGFHLPENFDRPYSSRSITEFWRRWHMSLSRWFRDYLYIPLGGNRDRRLATYRNLMIVFLSPGCGTGRRGRSWLWGAFHGVLLLLERRVRGRARGAIARWRRRWRRRRARRRLRAGAGTDACPRPPGLGALPLGRPARGDRRLPGVPAARLPLAPKVVIALDPMATIALVVGALSFLLPPSWVTGVRLASRSVAAGRRVAAGGTRPRPADRAAGRRGRRFQPLPVLPVLSA